MFRQRFPHLRRALPFAILIAIAVRGSADTIKRTVAPGVEFSQEIIAPPTGPLLINVLRINLRAPGVRIESALGKDIILADDPTLGREAVGSVAARHGAIAAVNADFFPYTGDPLNILIRNGELLSESMPHRVCMGVTADGQVRFENLLTIGTLLAADGSTETLDGVNRMVAANEIVVLTPTFGPRTRAIPTDAMVLLNDVNQPVRVGHDVTGTVGSVVDGDPRAAIPTGGAVLIGRGRGAEWLKLHVHGAESVHFRFDCISNPLPSGTYRKDLASRAASFRGRSVNSVWTDVVQAVGGGPWLVRGGKQAVDGREESLDQASFVMARHPRTAAGTTESGELLLVTVDGRQESLSKGMSLPELADTMIRLGAKDAINLDGGGSTTMAIRGAYVNSPSDGSPRLVASSLLVFASAPVTPLENLDLRSFRAGERFNLNDSGTAADGIWATQEGRGVILQNGVGLTTAAGLGTALCFFADRTLRIPYAILPGPPAKLRATIGTVPNNPPDRNSITVSVLDAFGNPIPGQIIHVQATAGTSEQADLTSDSTGHATAEIVWDADKGRNVTLTAGSLPPLTIKVK